MDSKNSDRDDSQVVLFCTMNGNYHLVSPKNRFFYCGLPPKKDMTTNSRRINVISPKLFCPDCVSRWKSAHDI